MSKTWKKYDLHHGFYISGLNENLKGYKKWRIQTRQVRFHGQSWQDQINGSAILIGF